MSSTTTSGRWLRASARPFTPSSTETISTSRTRRHTSMRRLTLAESSMTSTRVFTRGVSAPSGGCFTVLTAGTLGGGRRGRGDSRVGRVPQRAILGFREGRGQSRVRAGIGRRRVTAGRPGAGGGRRRGSGDREHDRVGQPGAPGSDRRNGGQRRRGARGGRARQCVGRLSRLVVPPGTPSVRRSCIGSATSWPSASTSCRRGRSSRPARTGRRPRPTSPRPSTSAATTPIRRSRWPSPFPCTDIRVRSTSPG